MITRNQVQNLAKRLKTNETTVFRAKRKRFLLTVNPSILSYKVFVNLDFSFREKVFDSKKSIIETEFPIIFKEYVYHLSKEGIAAEKIRAIMTRKKGRDLYDLWFLLNSNVELDNKLIRQKLRYYKLGKISKADIFKRIENFAEKDFILDLRPFVPINEREKLADFFIYLKEFLKTKL